MAFRSRGKRGGIRVGEGLGGAGSRNINIQEERTLGLLGATVRMNRGNESFMADVCNTRTTLEVSKTTIRRYKMGSVKDLKVMKKATVGDPGRARFIFSDSYSIFDWGEMPDHISGKGIAIALLGAYFFRKTRRNGSSYSLYRSCGALRGQETF